MKDCLEACFCFSCAKFIGKRIGRHYFCIAKVQKSAKFFFGETAGSPIQELTSLLLGIDAPEENVVGQKHAESRGFYEQGWSFISLPSLVKIQLTISPYLLDLHGEGGGIGDAEPV